MPKPRWIALFGAFVLAVFPPLAAAQSPTFARDDYASFTGARGIVVGDFDRNGWPDIAQANTTRNTVTILLNHDGVLTKASDVPVDRGPFDIASGDFNGDGMTDLVVTTADANSIALLAGQADGKFASPVRFVFTDIRSPRGIAVADVNRDGKADLLVTGYDSNGLTVLLGDGRGGFTRGASWFGPFVQPQGVAVADFNRDGRADVLVAADGAAGLVVQYGNGSTNVFATGSVVPGAHDFNVVSVGDVNGDGWPDAIAASTRHSQVAVFLGGASGLTLSRTYGTGSSPRGITLADVNIDGMLDVITADYASSTVSVLLGKKSAPGTFDAASQIASNSGSRAVATADFNLDGRPDLATGNQNVAFTTVLTNSTIFATTGFSFHTTLLGTPSSVAGSNAVFAADFNRDGKLDLATRAPYPAIGVSILLTGGATVTLTGPTQFYPEQFLVTDVNGDGNPDVLVANCGSGLDLFTQVGNGRGGFTPSAHTTASLTGCGVVPGNFNGDAYPDLAVVGYDQSVASYVLRTMFGNGNGTFRPGASRLLDANYHTMAAVGDLNRDGRTDALVANTSGLEVWFGNGAGGFTSSVVVPVRNGIPSVQIADLNHDGYPDLVARTFDELGIVLNSAAGFRGASYIETTHTNFSGFGNDVAVADMNLDGNLDIVTDQGALLPGFGDGTFGAVSWFDFGLDSSGLRIADFNRDGLPDLLVGQSHGSVRLLVNERNSVNHPPIADAGSDRTINYQEQFIDANGFSIGGGPGGSDPDSHALRFEWSDSTNTVFSTDRVAESAPRRPGTYTFKLTVFDERGGSASDSVSITIAPTKEVVLYAALDTALAGSSWTTVADASAAGGERLYNPNAGAPKVTTPAANPASFVDVAFVADPTQVYKLWIRLKADGNNFANDSIWVQFRGSTTAAGTPAYRIGTTSGLAVNLEECSGCGLAGWGWEDDGWGAVNRNGTTIRFPEGGTQFIRIQQREDGVSIDQIVLSSEKYLTARPGSAKNDQTILPRTYVPIQ
jgi:hypothetical protein